MMLPVLIALVTFDWCCTLSRPVAEAAYQPPPLVTPYKYDDLTSIWTDIGLPNGVIALKAQPDWYRWWFVTLEGYILTLPDMPADQSDLKEVLDINDRTRGDVGYTENGLVGFAFSPHFHEDRQFYTYYIDIRDGTQTDVNDIDSGRLDPALSAFQPPSCRSSSTGWHRTAMVSRFTWYPDDPTRTRKSEEALLFWGNMDLVYHAGGALFFVGDYLHIGTGDQTDSWQAQSLDSPKGKILRINPFVSENGRPYSVPADNPFVGLQSNPEGQAWLPEIYSFGVRNPFRCAVDDGGMVVCGVVGQDAVESVVVLAAGANFGWPDYEGSVVCNEADNIGDYAGRAVPGCSPVVVADSTCVTEPEEYNLTGSVFSYCHEKVAPLTGPFVEGVCSDLVTGVNPIPIGFYNGAGDADGLLKKGDFLFGETGGGSGAKIVKLTPSEQLDWRETATIVYGTTDTDYVNAPFFVVTGVDWSGELIILRYDSSDGNFAYRWDKLRYKDYPDSAVGTEEDVVSATSPPTESVTETSGPFVAPIAVPTFEVCGASTAFNYTELEWTDDGDGAYSGTVTMNAVTYTNRHGTTTTRSYFTEDGVALIPGPVIRMKPGGVYNVTLVNALDSGWPNPEAGLNSYRRPSTTNLHLHGLHVSPQSPADDMSTEVWPGESYTYTYVIPADHEGGTHIYHAHVHGSTALQAGAGAIGMLIIEDNEYLDVNDVWPAMPEAMIVMQAMTPNTTFAVGLASGDRLYQTTATQDYYMVNGCDEASFNLELMAAQWTRLRMLHIGSVAGAVVVAIRPVAATAGPGAGARRIMAASKADSTQCEAAVLAKDGVYLSDAPRMLLEPSFLFAISSRVDVAIRCPSAGQHNFTISSAHTPAISLFASNLTVLGTDNASLKADLRPWTPVRPYYLQNLREEVVSASDGQPSPYSVVIRANTVNGFEFRGFDALPMKTISIDSVNEWIIQFSTTHPMHLHINHMQLVMNVNNYDVMPDWHQPGDWLDTIDFPGDQLVRFRADRYGGAMMIHCHVFEHADTGSVAMVQIEGGERANGGRGVLKWPQGLTPSSCNGVIELGETVDDCAGPTPAPAPPSAPSLAPVTHQATQKPESVSGTDDAGGADAESGGGGGGDNNDILSSTDIAAICVASVVAAVVIVGFAVLRNKTRRQKREVTHMQPSPPSSRPSSPSAAAEGCPQLVMPMTDVMA